MRSIFTLLFFITLHLSGFSQALRTATVYSLIPVDCPTLSPEPLYDLCAGSPATIVPVILAPGNATINYEWSALPGSQISGGINNMDLITSSVGIYTLTASNGSTHCSSLMTYTVTECADVGIKENRFDVLVSVSPNPFHDFLNLASSEALAATLSDAYGKIILVKKYTAGKNRIDLNALPAGLYYLNLRSNEEYKTIKVLKE